MRVLLKSKTSAKLGRVRCCRMCAAAAVSTVRQRIRQSLRPRIVSCRRLTECVLVSVAASLATPAIAAEVGVILDRSPSMETDDRLLYAKEGAKLLIGVLGDEDRVNLVGFSFKATTGNFNLATDRAGAERWLRKLPVDSGTDFLAGLSAVKWKPSQPIVMLTDGEHVASPPQTVLDYVDRELVPRKVRVHTIGVACPAGSNQASLLGSISSRTGGAFLRLEDTEDIVTSLVQIGTRIGSYRSCVPRQDSFEFTSAGGTALAIGYDCDLEVAVAGVDQNARRTVTSRLPAGMVQVTAVKLSAPGKVIVTMTRRHSPKARIASVFQSGLPSAALQLDAAEGTVEPGQRVSATIHSELNGVAIDPRNLLDARLKVLDSSGQVLETVEARPSASEPVLEAELRMPSTPGSVRVQMESRLRQDGETWTSRDEKSLVVNALRQIVSVPARVRSKGQTRRVVETIQLELDRGDLPVGNWAGRLTKADDGLDLVSAVPTTGSGLRLTFDVSSVGEYQGTLTVSHSASGIASLSVPVSITCESPLQGLFGMKVDTLELGTVPAFHGTLSSVLPVNSRDSAAVEYQVLTRDLTANGVILPTAAGTRLTVLPGKPADLKIQVDVGAVPAGLYSGSITLAPTSDPGLRWTRYLKLQVTSALVGRASGAGDLPVGGFASLVLTLENRGAKPIAIKSFEAPREFRQGSTVVAGIDVRMTPDTIRRVDAQSEQAVQLRFAALDRIAVRGAVTGDFTVTTSEGTEITVPCTVKVTDARPTTQFRIVPERLELSGSHGSLLSFDLRVRPSAELAVPNDLEILTGAFQKDGTPHKVSIDFRPDAGRLLPDRPTDFKGAVFLPPTPGLYIGEIVVRSPRGRVVVPVQLSVD